MPLTATRMSGTGLAGSMVDTTECVGEKVPCRDARRRIGHHHRHHFVTLARSAAPDRERAEPRRDDRGSLKLFRSWPKLICGGDMAPNPGTGAGPRSRRQGGRLAP
jgi:hypothetical protein